MFRGEVAEISTYIQNAIENEFSGNVIDVCPVGALTDKTFRFKSRVWFTKPVDAHRSCDKCSGNVRLWYKGDEILRVTARKDEFGEVVEWICNDCRFHKKTTSDWTIEGPAKINKHSVMSANHYLGNVKKEIDLQRAILNGMKARLGEGALNPNNIKAEI
jgi:NADH-quinone oxidoreductase subunit G